MISLYRFDTSAQTGRWSKVDSRGINWEQWRSSNDILWIDLDQPTPEEEQLVFESLFKVHPLTVEDITRLRREPTAPPHFPKVEEFPDYLFVIVNPLAQRFLARMQDGGPTATAEDERPGTQLSAILTKTLLITHHYESLSSTHELAAFLGRHDTNGERGPDYLFHLVLDGMVDEYAPVLDRFDESLDEVEIEVLQKPAHYLLEKMLHLKRQIVRLRKTLVYEREVLARLSRGEFGLIAEREMAYYRNVYDHLVRFAELIESSREMVSDLMQTHLSAISNKLNEIMKVLTMISTVVLPMTLIAGIYGKNFEGMPETKWHYGYEYALALMALTGFGSFLLFRWKKWL